MTTSAGFRGNGSRVFLTQICPHNPLASREGGGDLAAHSLTF